MEFQCNHRNSFCYICGHFAAKRNVKKRNEQFVIWLRRYYGDEFEWIDESYTPSVACSACYISMKRCFDDNEKKPKYKNPMKWYDPGAHDSNTCYFCINTQSRVNTPRSQNYEYKASPYVEMPVLHTSASPPLNVGFQQPDEPIDFGMDEDVEMNFDAPADDMETEVADFTDVAASTSSYTQNVPVNVGIRLINQARLNNMCRRLELSQRKSIMLAEMLKEDNILASDVTMVSQRKRSAAFFPYFANAEKLSYCSNITGLMKELNIDYDATDWRLFIDASKSGLEGVLLHNDGAYMPVPIAYSRELKETYASMKLIFDKVRYSEHKNSCFICTWVSTAKIKHYHATWEKRGEFEIGVMNIAKKSCCPREKILLPTLHIKLGLVSSFVRKLDKDGEAFQYLGVLFPRLSIAKRKQGKHFHIFIWLRFRFRCINVGFYMFE